MKSVKNLAFFLIMFAPLIFGVFSALVKFTGPDPLIQMNMQQMQELEQEMAGLSSGEALSEENGGQLESLRSEYDTLRRSLVLRRTERIKWTSFIIVMILIVGILVLLPGVSNQRNKAPGSQRASTGQPAASGQSSASGQPAETGGVITPAGLSTMRLQDPVSNGFASTVDWSPLKGGGANFKTHSLHSRGNNVLLLKSSNSFNLFSLAFGIPAVILLVFEFVPGLILGDFSGIPSVLSFALRVNPTPYIFILLSIGLMFLFNSVTRIDAGERSLTLDGEKLSFDAIAGFQVVSEMVASRNSGMFVSHELNVVLNDGSRKNLMDHGDLSTVMKDGERIAGLVGVPLWGLQYN